MIIYRTTPYDDLWKVRYEDVKDKITQKECMITQMYFNNWYTWGYVIENLKKLKKWQFPVY